MFSGLVREFAKVRFYNNNILCLESKLHPNIGDSIAVNGACLTAIKSDKQSFCVELAQNTAKSIAIENLKDLVHIEPALSLKDGLHGHIMQGHIDSIGIIKSIKTKENQSIFHISASKDTLDLMINKGSVCIDGISLTINAVFDSYFELVIIPHTMQHTLFNTYKINRRVNIETDIIARTIHSFLDKFLESKNILSKDSKKALTQEICDNITLMY